MNSITRAWLTWKHRRKFARLGKKCVYPIELLNIEGHVEQGDFGRFRNNATMRTHGNGRIIWGNRAGASWGVLIEAHELVEVGDYTGIAEFAYITDTVVQLLGNNDNFAGARRESRPVRIGQECFIGSGAIIGPGVTIGDGAVIGPHSVVMRDVGPYEIWLGNPARRISHRTQGVPESKLEEYRRLVQAQGIQRDRYKDDF